MQLKRWKADFVKCYRHAIILLQAMGNPSEVSCLSFICV